MRVLDLFAGACGGWSLGLHRTGGFRTVAACEIDPWRREQYAKNFPGVKLYDDVRTLTADRLRAHGIVCDAIVGSPPCQDASAANAKGKGVDGERTGLFFEAVRLVRELRPDWVALENVPGIRNRGIDRVLGELEAAGYTCWPLVVGAVDLGANHRRKRVVVVAHAAQVGRDTRPGSVVAFPEPKGRAALPHPDRQGEHAGACDAREVVRCASDGGNAPDAMRWGRHIRDIGYSDQAAVVAPEDIGEERNHWSSTAPDFGRVDDGISDRMARACISAYGDAFCPQQAEAIGRVILAAEAAR